MVASDPLNADDDAVEMLLQQNLMTSLRLTQVVAKRMIKQAEAEGREEGLVGSIINLSLDRRAPHPSRTAGLFGVAARRLTR